MWSKKDLISKINTIIKTESVFDIKCRQALPNQTAASHVTEDVSRFIKETLGNIELDI